MLRNKPPPPEVCNIGLVILFAAIKVKMAKEDKNRDLKQYPFPLDEVPRLSIHNPETEKRIADGVILLFKADKYHRNRS